MNEQIMKLLAQSDYAPSNVPELIAQLGLDRSQQQELQRELLALDNSGQILRIKGNRYILASQADLIPGTIQITRQGRGFVQPDDTSLTEISVTDRDTATALNGDRVLVRRNVASHGAGPDHVATGTIVRILERKRNKFVGTLRESQQVLFVVPDDPRMGHDIIVASPKDVGRPANIGDKVVVEILDWEARQANPIGEIVEVLGSPDQEGVDMLSVLRHYDLPLSFPKAVLKEANLIVASHSLTDASPDDLAGRTDCRHHTVVTIDPDDAKDFDDAIYIEPQAGNRWRLWVHIADVSHYVSPGSVLDVEARLRGNSTYLVDRVIPMLPEALSNELCSLKPNVDRLTKCVEFSLAEDGQVLSSKFYSAVIRSARRFTYKEALACIQRAPTSAIETMVHQAHALAQRLRKARFENGSLELDFPESKIRLDDHGRIRLIERIENDVSHQLIEEFMLLANEAVAGKLMGLNRPAVYRVHESPKAKRLLDYRDEVRSHKIVCGDLTQRSEVQKLLARLQDIPIGAALRIGFLKSLMRARYAVEPLGHYGLAKTKYAHFTSPIRRYADLIIHRALFDSIQLSNSDIKEAANHITNTERNSADAERDSKDVKLFAYLQAQLLARNPQSYRAIVTDVRNFVFFVDVLDLGMSGGVPLSSLREDFFVFDPQRRQLQGRQTGRIIRLGDEVMVQVCKVNQADKQVDFQLVTPRTDKPRFTGRAKPTEASTWADKPKQVDRSKPTDTAKPNRSTWADKPKPTDTAKPSNRSWAGKPKQQPDSKPTATPKTKSKTPDQTVSRAEQSQEPKAKAKTKKPKGKYAPPPGVKGKKPRKDHK
jgi:ribonuclease R